MMMMSSSRGRELQGPRPAPLKVNNTSSKIIKKSSSSHPKINRSGKIEPVVIYLSSPKIIHVRPEEFMGLVQRLTGKDSTATTTTDNQVSYPSSPLSSSGDMAAPDESMAELNKRDNVNDMFGGADQMKKGFHNEVDFGDQNLGMSPTWLRFLTCM